MNIFRDGIDVPEVGELGPEARQKGSMDRARVDAYWKAALAALADRTAAAADDAWLGRLRTELNQMGRHFIATCQAGQGNLGKRYIKTVEVPGLSKQNHLGDAVRWLAVLKVLVHYQTSSEPLKPNGSAEECSTRFETYSAGREADLKWLWGELWITAKGGPIHFSAANKSEFFVLLDWFNDLSVRRGRRRLTAHDIVNRAAPWGDHPAATLQAFHDWLITDVWVAPCAKRAPATEPAPGQLAEAAERIVGMLVAAGTAQAPIVNVTCGEARSLVEPFVDAVVARISTLDSDEKAAAEEGAKAEAEASKTLKKKDGRQARRKPDWAMGTTVITLAVGADSQQEGDGRMLTTTEALSEIASALGIVVDARELRESDRLYRNVMAEVRRACTLRRCVIVLHGVEFFEGRHAPLLNLMKGRGWGAFVRVLCQPHWQTALQFWGQDGVQEIRGARVLVISDAHVATLGRWADKPFRLPGMAAAVEAAKPSWAPLAEAMQADSTMAPEVPARAVRDVVMLAFVACSPDGVSFGALLRGMQHWLDLAGRILSPRTNNELVEAPSVAGRKVFDALLSGSAIIEAVDELLQRYRADIVRSKDEPLPWVSKERMQFEWQARADVLDLPLDAGQHGVDILSAKIHFRSEAKRRLFVRTLLTDAKCRRPSGGWPLGIVLGDHLWRLVNFSIALEALRQATSQLRSLGARDAYKLEATRRLVQTVYHLRAAGDIEISGQDGAYAPYLSIPKAAIKRRRYTYSFLLLRCVDGDRAYRLARTHARAEIRVPLLALFLVEDVRSLECGKANDTKAFIAALEKGYERLQSDPKPLGQELLPDILVSLATAAIDADDFAVAKWALEKIDLGRQALQASDTALIWSGREIDERRVIDSWAGGYGAAHAKLQFDLEDKAGKGKEAEKRCDDALSGLAVGVNFLSEVENAVDAYLLGAQKASAPSSITDLEARLGSVITGQVNRQYSARRQMAISEMLFRKADVLASAADECDRFATPRVQRLRALLVAFGHFFVADRLRSHVSGKSGYGVAWSRLSAKGNRVYVRTCLAIARTLVELDQPLPGKPAKRSVDPSWQRARYAIAIEFMQHAAHRSDVFVRHLHPHRREVLHGLLLKSSEVRTWATIAKFRPLSEAGAAATTHVAPSLEQARCYLEDAETILHDMGVPNEPARRVWLERISLFIGSVQELHPRAEAHAFAALVEADLDTAERLMGDSDFWGPLILRQRDRWKETRKRLGLDSPGWT